MTYKILLVDDEILLRSELCDYFRESGYLTFEAEDGNEAQQVLEINSIDLIISDLIMPRCDGSQLLKAIRKGNLTIPIIILAGVCTQAEAKSLISLGASAILRKPIPLTELHKHVTELLRKNTQ